MSNLLKTKKQYKESQGIKWLLHNELSGMDEPRDLSILHASELTNEDNKFCPRQRALLLRDGDTRRPTKLGTSLGVAYQIGRWYEHSVRNVWLRKYVLGDWSCPVCDHVYKAQTSPDTESCPSCTTSGTRAEYIEPRAYSKYYETSCGIDMVLYQNNTITAVEIKSIDKDYFRKLKAPMSEHRHRTKFYLDLLEHSTWMDYDVKINTEYAKVLYVCKGFGFKDDYEGRVGVDDSIFSPFKEYTVQRGKHEDMKGIYDLALQVKEYNKTGVLPPRQLCKTYTCTKAKWCPVKATCFTEK